MLALGGALISEFPMNTFAAPQNFPLAIASSAAFGSAFSWWEPPNIALALRSGTESRGVRRSRHCRQQKFLGTDTLIKQAATLTARWEDVWEELPTRVRLALTPVTGDESQADKTASLFGESELPHTKDRH